MPLGTILGSMMLGAIVQPALTVALRASGRETSIGGIMGQYDIIAYDDDDELSGGIGADEDSLLEALAVSGAGDTDIIGEQFDIVGARKAKRALALRRAVAQKNAAVVQKVGLQSKRRNPLGFVPVSVAAGVSSQIPAAPQNLFRAERLVVPSDIAFDFGVTDIKVGNVSQLVQSAELPAAIFSEVAIDTNVSWDTAEVGNQISIVARNKSALAIDFTAALLGTIAKR